MPLVALMLLFTDIYTFWFLFRREFFTYTHWPVRFNRKNRTVYIFKHNGRNGVLRVPFDEIYFHLGRPDGTDPMYDLRGEVLEGKIVKHTFAVGNPVPDQANVGELWEFILRYMEQGPEGLDFKRIDATVADNWTNAYMYSVGRLPLPRPLFVLLYPLFLVGTALRRLVMLSCRKPVWPADVEAECAVDPDDPYDLPQPTYISEFMTDEEYARL